MNYRIKIGIGVAAGVLVLGAGGAGMAYALSGTTSQVSGLAAEQARAAAAGAVPGGTPGAVVTENGPGPTAYQVTVTRPDGNTVQVHLDGQDHVLGTQAPGQDRDTDGDRG